MGMKIVGIQLDTSGTNLKKVSGKRVSDEQMTTLLHVYLLYRVGITTSDGEDKENLTKVCAGIDLVLQVLGVQEEFEAAYDNLEKEAEKEAGKKMEECTCDNCRKNIEKLKEKRDYDGRY